MKSQHLSDIGAMIAYFEALPFRSYRQTDELNEWRQARRDELARLKLTVTMIDNPLSFDATENATGRN